MRDIFSGILSFGANALSNFAPRTDSHSGSTLSTDERHIQAESIPGSFPDELDPASHCLSTDSEATGARLDYTPSPSSTRWTQRGGAIAGVQHHLLNPSPAKTAREHAEHENTRHHQVYPKYTMQHRRSKSKSPRRQRKDMYRSKRTAKNPESSTWPESDDSSSWATDSSLGTPSTTSHAQTALENARENAREAIVNLLKPVGSPFRDDGREGDMVAGTHVFPTEDDDDEPMLAIDQLAISDEKEGDLGDHGAEKQLHTDQQHEDHRRERQRIEEQRRIAAEQKRLRETGGLRGPRHRLVTELSRDWRHRIMSTLSQGNDTIVQTKSGNSLKARDFEKVIHPQAWLNDEIVNGSLEWLDDYINTDNRKCQSFGSFLWPRIKSGQSTDRLLRRLGVSNAEAFLTLETILIPICAGSHWTLVVIRPKGRAVAHMDSMNPGGSPSVLKTAREWVKRVCGDKFVEAQWSIAKYQAPLQINGNDCGVHVITNGLCIAMGVNPMEAYKATEMPLQRLRIAGMLLNRGFSGDFELGNF